MRYLLVVLCLLFLIAGFASTAAATPGSSPLRQGAVIVAGGPSTMLDGIDWDEWLMLDGIDWDEWLSALFGKPPAQGPKTT